MKLSSVSVSMAAVALLATGVALWPASAQPAGDKPVGGQPAGDKGRPGTPGPRGGDRAGEPPSEWREKFKDEAREHPRLGRALITLHEARDYLDKSPNEFGGHKKITEAIKFDEKHDAGKGGGRGDRNPSGDKPAGDKPPAPPKP
jgi:hypothetical protein